MTDQVIIKQRIQGIISVRVVREPDQCTGRQDVRKYSVNSINELIDQVNRAISESGLMELKLKCIYIYTHIYIYGIN